MRPRWTTGPTRPASPGGPPAPAPTSHSVWGPTPRADGPEAAAFARRAARLLDLGALHFDRGIRAYYYTFAATAWFIHPVLFMIATVWVTAVLLRREFRSRTRNILLSEPD